MCVCVCVPSLIINFYSHSGGVSTWSNSAVQSHGLRSGPEAGWTDGWTDGRTEAPSSDEGQRTNRHAAGPERAVLGGVATTPAAGIYPCSWAGSRPSTSPPPPPSFSSFTRPSPHSSARAPAETSGSQTRHGKMAATRGRAGQGKGGPGGEAESSGGGGGSEKETLVDGAEISFAPVAKDHKKRGKEGAAEKTERRGGLVPLQE